MDYGLIVDLETTGLDPQNDAIIEIGLLEFVIEEGKQPVISRMYAGLEDPGREIPEDVANLTGIANEHVVGQAIDWALVHSFFSKASVAIAHHAAFDASFLRRRPELAPLNVHWACSASHIDWRAHGFKSRTLNYLACDHGFLNPFAHRALFDCATTFRVISPYIGELIDTSYEKRFRVKAVASPFEMKDRLRSSGYHWDAAERVWYKDVFSGQLERERQFLSLEIYQGGARHVEQELGIDLQ